MKGGSLKPQHHSSQEEHFFFEMTRAALIICKCGITNAGAFSSFIWWEMRLNKIDQIGSDYIPAKSNQITVSAARGYHVIGIFGHFIWTSKIMDWTIIT